MCIRDRVETIPGKNYMALELPNAKRQSIRLSEILGSQVYNCLLYTSDAADERSSVDLGGRRIIKKKNYDELSDRSTSDN